MEAIDIVVYGKVQKVWFRKSTKTIADELGIVGMVKNQIDGSVYIHAEGISDNLNKLTKWCEQGPENAIVERVVTNRSKVEGCAIFEIERLKDMTEKEKKLLLSLEENIDWPCVYIFKFIFKKNEENLKLMNDFFSKDSEIVIKESSGGNYYSFTAKEMMLSAKNVIEKYRKTPKIEGLISL